MLFLTTNTRKRSTLIAITILSILLICLQLLPYEYNSLPLPNNILNWGTEGDAIDEQPSPVSGSDSNHNDQLVTPSPSSPPPPPPPPPASDEKYLTYLPYSRFSNQRGTLQNAALLAKYLGRTLVVPPMFLGYANGWSPGPLLYPILEHMTDPHLQDHCFDDSGALIPEEPTLSLDESIFFGCSNFTDYAMVPWSAVTDLNLLTRPEENGGLGIKILERSDMSLVSLRQELGLMDDKDVYLMKDSSVS
jgi:hypothetical protein